MGEHSFQVFPVGDVCRIFSDGGLLYPERGVLGDHANGWRRTEDMDMTGINYAIDYVNGSCMLFRKEVLDDIGFMEENLFMYYEESEWCYRLKNSPKWRIGIDTDVASGQSDGSRGRAYEYYMTRNRIWMTKKHAGNLSSVVWERIRFAWKKSWSFRMGLRERTAFSCAVLKGIFHGLTGRMGKIAN